MHTTLTHNIHTKYTHNIHTRRTSSLRQGKRVADGTSCRLGQHGAFGGGHSTPLVGRAAVASGTAAAVPGQGQECRWRCDGLRGANGYVVAVVAREGDGKGDNSHHVNKHDREVHVSPNEGHVHAIHTSRKRHADALQQAAESVRRLACIAEISLEVGCIQANHHPHDDADRNQLPLVSAGEVGQDVTPELVHAGHCPHEAAHWVRHPVHGVAVVRFDLGAPVLADGAARRVPRVHHVRGLGKDAALQAGVAVRVQVVGLAGGHVLGVRPPVERRLHTESLDAPQREQQGGGDRRLALAIARPARQHVCG
mmetsp:Transcript_8842/g.18164  ORF Transcript_8842/g.18164 Transcript_8842/m.18164 type:complete len:310 (+) Transcript_8842:17-946(+)